MAARDALPGGWISLEDRLPEFHKPVLGHNEITGMMGVCELEYDGPPKRRWHRWHINLPTHWQELPEGLPRKADREDLGQVIAEFDLGVREMSLY